MIRASGQLITNYPADGFLGHEVLAGERRDLVTPRQWANLVEALGLGAPVAAVEAARGVSFARDDGMRFTHRDALFPLFEAAIAARDHADLAQVFDAGGVVHSRYGTMLGAARDSRLVGDNPIFDACDNPSGLAPAAGAFASLPQRERRSHGPHRATANTARKCSPMCSASLRARLRA